MKMGRKRNTNRMWATQIQTVGSGVKINARLEKRETARKSGPSRKRKRKKKWFQYLFNFNVYAHIPFHADGRNFQSAAHFPHTFSRRVVVVVVVVVVFRRRRIRAGRWSHDFFLIFDNDQSGFLRRPDVERDGICAVWLFRRMFGLKGKTFVALLVVFVVAFALVALGCSVADVPIFRTHKPFGRRNHPTIIARPEFPLNDLRRRWVGWGLEVCVSD